jgi:flagellar biosynthetic protein FliO
MKAVFIMLMVLMLFSSCAFGQATATSAPGPESGNVTLSPAVAADPIQHVSTAEAQDDGMRFPVFRTLGGMGIVLSLMIGIYFGAKKFAPRYFPKAAAEKNLKVLESLSLGDRRSISLIEVAGSRYLVGNTPQQINLLAALPLPISLVSEPEALPATVKEKSGRESPSPFRNLFEVEKKEKPQPAASALPDDIRAKMRQLREALER